jgi:hypothetical protein
MIEGVISRNHQTEPLRQIEFGGITQTKPRLA